MDEVSSEYSFPFFPMENDTLHALVIYCNFPSPSGDFDISGTSILQYWSGISSQIMPSWADSIICPSTTNIWNRSLTGLYKDASFGNFWLIGDIYPHLYIFQEQVVFYSPDSLKIGAAVKELLINLDDSINFAEYDKFDPFDLNNNDNKREPDGIVDFIFINFRFNNSATIDYPSYSGIAELGGRDGRFGYGVSELTLDGKRILAGFPGSGCLYEMNSPWDIGIPSHEFGEHYSYGGGHSEAMGAFNINGGGIASAYDREFLGWDNSGLTPNSNLTTSIADYITSGDYIKIQRTHDVIYLENIRRLSYYASEDYRIWKWLSTDPKYLKMPDSGLVIYRNTGFRTFDIQSAYGFWDWDKCTGGVYKVEFYSPTFNHFFQKNLNLINGESTFELYKKSVKDLNCQTINIGGQPVNEVTYMAVNGDSNTCFDVGYNEVYSPWSNPSLPVTNSNDSLTIEITGRDSNGNLTLNIYFTNILGASPSKPQGLKVEKHTSGNGFNPLLNWNKNHEPDLTSYNVYRGTVSTPGIEPSSYDSIANTNDTVYIDQSIFLYGTGSGPCYHIYRYAYKISAIDNTNKKSVKSEKAGIEGYENNCDPNEESFVQNFNSNINESKAAKGIDNLTTYKLYDNYPNPFNPVTTIKFELPVASLVLLRIYDITGKEVETLFNEFKLKGRYSVSFNATNYSSGIYFYKLQTENYINIKKMVLLK